MQYDLFWALDYLDPSTTAAAASSLSRHDLGRIRFWALLGVTGACRKFRFDMASWQPSSGFRVLRVQQGGLHSAGSC